MNKWQSIETAPKDGTPILFWCPSDSWHPSIQTGSWQLDCTDYSQGYWQMIGLTYYGADNIKLDVKQTHWMPMIEGPK